MKIRIIFYAFMTCLLCFVWSCTKDSALSSGEVTLSFTSYYNESEGTTLNLWKSEDVAGLALTNQSNLNIDFASPESTGQMASKFNFSNLSDMSRAGTIVAFYPARGNELCQRGKISTYLSDNQDGTVEPLLMGKAQAHSGNMNIILSQICCVLYILIDEGDYSIAKAEISSNAGEGIAGDLILDADTWTVTATESKIIVTPSSPIDCSDGDRILAVTVAPITLSEGYTATLYDIEGNVHTIKTQESVTFKQGGKSYSNLSGTTKLVICGGSFVYMINADLVENGESYKDAITWSWQATELSSVTGLSTSSLTDLDECKPVDSNTKLLLCSSQGWCVLLDVRTKDVLFYTTVSTMAHSACLLPNNRLVVACSDGGDALQVYDISKPNTVLNSISLSSAHGVVWNDATQRLYAIGGSKLMFISLVDWDTDNPSLKVEATITTPKADMHDLMFVDDNTLSVAGSSAYLFNISQESFTVMPYFSGSTAIKSLNYNPANKEIWFTDATSPEGDYTWSTQTIRHVASPAATAEDMTIKVPDLNMYKVRVCNW